MSTKRCKKTKEIIYNQLKKKFEHVISDNQQIIDDINTRIDALNTAVTQDGFIDIVENLREYFTRIIIHIKKYMIDIKPIRSLLGIVTQYDLKIIDNIIINNILYDIEPVNVSIGTLLIRNYNIIPNICTWDRNIYNKSVLIEQTFFIKNLNASARKSLKRFTGMNEDNLTGEDLDRQYTAESLNEFLRTQSGEKFPNAQMQADYKNIRKIFKDIPPIKHDIIVYRGSGFMYSPKNEYISPTFVSTTLNRAIGAEFAIRADIHGLYTIRILKGTKVIPLIDTTHYKDEEEILLNTATRFRCGEYYEHIHTLPSTDESFTCAKSDCIAYSPPAPTCSPP